MAAEVIYFLEGTSSLKKYSLEPILLLYFYTLVYTHRSRKQSDHVAQWCVYTLHINLMTDIPASVNKSKDSYLCKKNFLCRY